MDTRERVRAALTGRKVDRVPFTMWRHFYLQAQRAEGLARSTLDFYRRYDHDLIVLTPGPYYLAEAWGAEVRSFSSDNIAPYVAGPRILRATEWRSLPELNVEDSPLVREIETVRLIRAELGAADAPLVVIVHSPLTTANVLCNGRVVDDMRSFSNDLRSALTLIAAATAEFVGACMEAGADGVMLASREASSDLMRSREYRDFGMPFDLQVLAAAGKDAIKILHLDVECPYFNLADRYPVQAVCWQTWRSEPSFASASESFRGALMGGLNPMTFEGGAAADVREQIGDALEQTGGWRLVIAPSGPVPPASREELLHAVRQVLAGDDS